MGSLLSLCCSQKSTPDWVVRMFLTHWAAARFTSILTHNHSTDNHNKYHHKPLTATHFHFTAVQLFTVPLLSECIIHTVENNVETLRLCGGEERHGLFKEGVSAMEQGDSGEIHWTQFSQTTACRLCGKRFVLCLNLQTFKKTGTNQTLQTRPRPQQIDAVE